MTEIQKPSRLCTSARGSFPFAATVVGVASCFIEAILKNHVPFSTGAEIALALGQIVPVAVVIRYLASRFASRQNPPSTKGTQRTLPQL